jgi:hypothetical protein
MSWNNLKVGSFNLKIMPLNPLVKEFPNCDANGNVLTRVAGKFDKPYYMNEQTGERHEIAFKLINGKALAKLPKTKEVKQGNYIEVNVSEVDDIIPEKMYLVKCPELFNNLKDSGKALLFGYTSGNGYKCYKAYIRPHNTYEKQMFCIMICGTTQMSELMTPILENESNKEKVMELTKTIQGVNRASVEDLMPKLF